MNRLETRSCEPSAPGGSGGRQGRLTDARLPAAPRARTSNDPEQVSVARNGENLKRKLPPAPARTRWVSTRFPARRTVIVTRSRATKPLPTTVRGAADRILRAGPVRAAETRAEKAASAVRSRIRPVRLTM